MLVSITLLTVADLLTVAEGGWLMLMFPPLGPVQQAPSTFQ